MCYLVTHYLNGPLWVYNYVVSSSIDKFILFQFSLFQPVPTLITSSSSLKKLFLATKKWTKTICLTFDRTRETVGQSFVQLWKRRNPDIKWSGRLKWPDLLWTTIIVTFFIKKNCDKNFVVVVDLREETTALICLMSDIELCLQFTHRTWELQRYNQFRSPFRPTMSARQRPQALRRPAVVKRR